MRNHKMVEMGTWNIGRNTFPSQRKFLGYLRRTRTWWGNSF